MPVLEKKSLPPQLNLVSKLEQVTGLRVAGNASENIIFSLTNLGDDGRGFLSHDAYIASRQNETELFADRVSTIQIFVSETFLILYLTVLCKVKQMSHFFIS